MANDIVRVKLNTYSRSETVVTIEHERDEPLGRGRMVTCIYLPVELARKTAEAIFRTYRNDDPSFQEIR